MIPPTLSAAVQSGLVDKLSPADQTNLAVWQLDGIVVHSKLILVDDEFASIGSANFMDRSMQFTFQGDDSELTVAAVSTGDLVRELRASLWAEHLRVSDPPARAEIRDLSRSLGFWRPAWGSGLSFAHSSSRLVFVGPAGPAPARPRRSRRPLVRPTLDARVSGCQVGTVLLFMVQGNVGLHPGRANLLEPALLLTLVVCFGVLAVALLEPVVARLRGRVRSRVAARRRQRAAASAELRARALMSELCPHGWRAQITLLEGSDGQPDGTSGGGGARVALDWAELERGTGRPVVMRRVWAPTISEALEAMVADRRTDETLEQIEHGAVADGALWPDP